jgi:hypothetical protein
MWFYFSYSLEDEMWHCANSILHRMILFQKILHFSLLTENYSLCYIFSLGIIIILCGNLRVQCC